MLVTYIIHALSLDLLGCAHLVNMNMPIIITTKYTLALD